MKKYFTYVCLLALALFAFATHAEAGKFKFKLKTASTVAIDLTKMFPGSDLKSVTIEGLTKDSAGAPASGLVFTNPDEMTAVHVDTDHQNEAKEIVVDDPNNVIKKIHFTPLCGIAKEDLTMLEFDAAAPMDIEELSFAGMNPAAHFAIGNAPASTQNLKVLDMTNAREFYVYEIFLVGPDYKGSTKLEKLLWSPHYGPGGPKLIGQIVRANKDLQLIDFSNTLDAIGHSDQNLAAQEVRKVIEYIPHYAENKLTLKVKNAWESTVKVIAPLKKVTIEPAVMVTGTADPKVYVTTYKFKYTIDGEEVEIAPNTTRLSDDNVANITAPGDSKALLYKTADGVYYSLNEGKNHNGENSEADAYGAKVVAPYDQVIELPSGPTIWYVSGSETVGVPNAGLTADQTVETKILGKMSDIRFSYYKDGVYTDVPVADLGFISVKDIAASAPTANPMYHNNDNYRYGRTMTGFTPDNAPKFDGYRFKEFLANIGGSNTAFAGPDFALTKENAADPTSPNTFGIAFKYVQLHKVKLMTPSSFDRDELLYVTSRDLEVEHDGTLASAGVPEDYYMKYAVLDSDYEFKGWMLTVENTPYGASDPVVDRATLLTIKIDKDYNLFAIYAKKYHLKFMSLDADGVNFVQVKDTLVSAHYKVLPEDFPTPAVRKGYDFKGWRVNSNPAVYTLENLVASPYLKDVLADYVFYPVYEASVYNITYVMHPSTLRKPSSPKTATAFESVKLPSVTAPADYKFLGWSVNTLNADKVYKAGENFSDYDADFTLHSVVHYNYNAQLNPEGIADFCARVGVAPSYKEAKDYIQNFKAISEATVVDIVDLNNATAVVEKVDFIKAPDVTTTGVKPISVQLTYTDGSTDQVTLYMTVLDATDLKNVIAEGEHELKNPTYTDVSALRTAIASAKTVYAKNDACKAELEAAKNAIITALNALVVQYEPLPEDQIAPADRIAIEYGINVAGAATYNATYGGAEVANHRVFKKGYTFVMNVTPAAGYSLEFFTIYKYNAKAKAFEVKDRVETFAQTLRYRFAEAGSYKVVANFSKGEYTFTYGVRNEAGKGAEFVAMYNGSAIKSGDKVPAGAKVRLVVALQDKARIVKWFVNDAVAAISAESRDNEFTVNADTKVEVELANVTAAEAVAASVKVGPNPFTNFFVIRGAQDFATYYVLNATGNRVAEGMVAGMNEVRVNAQSFAPGFYVVVLKKADGTVQAVKMIKR